MNLSKNIFLVLSLLLVIGAGCSRLSFSKPEVSGIWQLAFELPENWVMVKDYDADSKTAINFGIKADDSEIVVQSQGQKLCYGDEKCDDPQAVTPSSGDALIKVVRLDARRLLPVEELEDLGGGFYGKKLCEPTEGCAANEAGHYRYYLKTEDGSYEFTYFGQDDLAKRVILSAQVVTKFETPGGLEIKTQ